MDWSLKLSERAKDMKASEIRELLKLMERKRIISFAGGMPLISLIPKRQIADIAEECLLDNASNSLQYCPTEGITMLRECLLGLVREEGISNIGIENIAVTTASQQGLSLSGQVLIDHGDTIITEEPTYIGAIQAFKSCGANFLTIPLDKNGIKVDILEKELRVAEKKRINIKFIYLIPNFQNPTGLTLSLDRRLKVIELSKTYDVPLIEDDPYGEIRFGVKRLPSLIQLDKDKNTLSLRTFSKILSPGLRLGWVMGDVEIVNKITTAKQAADLCPSSITQFIAYGFIKRGLMKKYLNCVRKTYQAKRDRMIEALEKYFPEGVEWTRPSGGMFIWATVPKHIDTSQLLREAIEANIAFVPGIAFYPHRNDRCHMRLNFSLPTLREIEIGIKRLGKLLKKKIETHQASI
jgi:2-aminoadipate transaminase